MKVSYDKEARDRAKAAGAHLVTLDVVGEYAKAAGVSWQGVVDDPGTVDYLWKVFAWLANGRYKGEPAPAYTPPKPPRTPEPKRRGK